MMKKSCYDCKNPRTRTFHTTYSSALPALCNIQYIYSQSRHDFKNPVHGPTHNVSVPFLLSAVYHVYTVMCNDEKEILSRMLESRIHTFHTTSVYLIIPSVYNTYTDTYTGV